MDAKETHSDIKDAASSQLDIAVITQRVPESLRNMDEEEKSRLNKKLVRKMDAIILPIIGILYILNYIDRQNLAAAKLQGIMEDLNMTTQEFATAISILFVGYLPFQIPSNMIITKISRPGMCKSSLLFEQASADTLRHLRCRHYLGFHLRSHCHCEDIRSASCSPRCAWGG